MRQLCGIGNSAWHDMAFQLFGLLRGGVRRRFFIILLYLGPSSEYIYHVWTTVLWLGQPLLLLCHPYGTSFCQGVIVAFYYDFQQNAFSRYYGQRSYLDTSFHNGCCSTSRSSSLRGTFIYRWAIVHVLSTNWLIMCLDKYFYIRSVHDRLLGHGHFVHLPQDDLHRLIEGGFE